MPTKISSDRDRRRNAAPAPRPAPVHAVLVRRFDRLATFVWVVYGFVPAVPSTRARDESLGARGADGSSVAGPTPGPTRPARTGPNSRRRAPGCAPGTPRDSSALVRCVVGLRRASRVRSYYSAVLFER